MLRKHPRSVSFALTLLVALTCSRVHAGSRDRDARDLAHCRATMTRAGLRFAHRLEWQIGGCARQLQDCRLARRSGCMTSTHACATLAASLAAAQRDMQSSIASGCRVVPVPALMKDLGASMADCSGPSVAAVALCLSERIREAEAMVLASVDPSVCEVLDAVAMGDEACGGGDDGPTPPPPSGPLACGGTDALACPDGFVCDRTDGLCTQTAVAGRCIPADATCTDGEPVCGCDDHTYASDCARLSAGVVKQHAGSCDVEPQACDFLHPGCPSGMFCDLPAGDCGEGGTGMCRPMRADECNLCSAYVDGPLCGCDWNTYATECDRIAAGMPLWFRGACQ
jgi:hypothetical protein